MVAIAGFTVVVVLGFCGAGVVAGCLSAILVPVTERKAGAVRCAEHERCDPNHEHGSRE